MAEMEEKSKAGGIEEQGEELQDMVKNAGEETMETGMLEPSENQDEQSEDRRLLDMIQQRREDQILVEETKGRLHRNVRYWDNIWCIKHNSKRPYDLVTWKVKEEKASLKFEGMEGPNPEDKKEVTKAKYFVGNDQSHIENTIMDLMWFLWKPQTIHELFIKIEYEPSIEIMFDKMMKMFELAQIKSIKCLFLKIFMEHHPKAMPQFLKLFDPEVLKYLDLRSEDTDWNVMQHVVKSDQWKSLKEFTFRSFKIAHPNSLSHVHGMWFQTMCQTVFRIRDPVYLENNLYEIIRRFQHNPMVHRISFRLRYIHDIEEAKARQKKLLSILPPNDLMYRNKRYSSVAFARYYRMHFSTGKKLIGVKIRRNFIHLVIQ